MYRTLKYTVVTAVAAAALATSPALANPLTGGAAAPQSLHPDSSRAHYRDLFYRTDDAFTVRPIPTTPAPAQPRPVAETPPAEDGDTNGALLIGLGLAGAGVVVGAAGAMRRRRVAV